MASLPQMRRSLLVPALPPLDDPDVAEDTCLTMAVTDLPVLGQGLVLMPGGLAVLPQVGQDHTQAVQRAGLAQLVSHFAEDGQGLLVVGAAC